MPILFRKSSQKVSSFLTELRRIEIMWLPKFQFVPLWGLTWRYLGQDLGCFLKQEYVLLMLRYLKIIDQIGWMSKESIHFGMLVAASISFATCVGPCTHASWASCNAPIGRHPHTWSQWSVPASCGKRRGWFFVDLTKNEVYAEYTSYALNGFLLLQRST